METIILKATKTHVMKGTYMSNLPYHEQIDRNNVLHLRQLIQALPPFCSQFFRGIEPRTSSRTRIRFKNIF